MFTDGQLLLLLLWGIYLCDCLVWHDRYGVVFRSWWGVRWHVAGLEFGAGGMGKSNWEVAGHGMACVNPLDCGAQAVVGHVLPVAISRTAMPVSSSSENERFPWGGRPVA